MRIHGRVPSHTYVPSLPYFGDLVKSFIKLLWGISKEPIFYGDPTFFQSPIFLVSRYFLLLFLLWTCEILLPAFHFIGRIYTATIILHISTEKLRFTKEETSNWNSSLYIEIIVRYVFAFVKKTIILISHENKFYIISINLKVLSNSTFDTEIWLKKNISIYMYLFAGIFRLLVNHRPRLSRTMWCGYFWASAAYQKCT